jgi:hypothetical protein
MRRRFHGDLTEATRMAPEDRKYVGLIVVFCVVASAIIGLVIGALSNMGASRYPLIP